MIIAIQAIKASPPITTPIIRGKLLLDSVISPSPPSSIVASHVAEALILNLKVASFDVDLATRYM